MKKRKFLLSWAVAFGCCTLAVAGAERLQLSDGKSFTGWTGDTNHTWRISDGAFVGGSLSERVPRNEFLATTRAFTNFVLRLDVKLVGTEGFINGGVQIRSQRSQNPPNEMIGYQCDMGEGYWGSLYDESRRNKTLVKPAPEALERALKKGEWNRYEIRCEGKRIRSWLNGVPMFDFREPDARIPQFGLIGIQIHGGAKAEASYKNIEVQELP